MSGTISFPGVGISVSKSLPGGRVSGGGYPGVGTHPPGGYVHRAGTHPQYMRCYGIRSTSRQ